MIRSLGDAGPAVALLMLAACGPAPTAESRTLDTGNCREPQITYATNASTPGVLWMIGTPADVTLSCDDFTSDCLDFGVSAACGPHAAYFVLGTHVIHIDTARGGFERALNHELIHWWINQSSHPERASLHVCLCGSTAVDCWNGGCGEALMNPATTLTSPNDLDRAFVSWARNL